VIGGERRRRSIAAVAKEDGRKMATKLEWLRKPDSME